MTDIDMTDEKLDTSVHEESSSTSISSTSTEAHPENEPQPEAEMNSRMEKAMKKIYEKYLFVKRQNEALTEELSSCKNSQDSLQETIVVLRSQKAAAEDSALKASQEAKDIAKRALDLQSMVDVAEAGRKQTEERVEACSREMTDMNNRMKALEDLLAKHENMASTNKLLTSELEDVKNSMKLLQEEYASSEQAKTELQRRCEAQHTSLQQAQITATNAEAKCSATQGLLDEANKTLSDAKTMCGTLEQQVASLKSSAQKLDDDLTSARTENAKLEESKKELMSRIEELQQQQNSTADKLERLEELEQQDEARRKEYERAIAERDAALQSASGFEAATQKLAETQASLEMKEKELAAQKRLLGELDELRTKAALLGEELNNARNDRERALAQSRTAAEELSKEQCRSQQLLEQLEKTKSLLQEAEAKHSAAVAEADSLREDKSSLESALESQNAALRTSSDTLEDMRKSYESHIEALKAQITEITSRPAPPSTSSEDDGGFAALEARNKELEDMQKQQLTYMVDRQAQVQKEIDSLRRELREERTNSKLYSELFCEKESELLVKEKLLEETDMLRDKVDTISQEASRLKEAFEKTSAEKVALEREHENELLEMKLEMQKQERESDETVKHLEEEIQHLKQTVALSPPVLDEGDSSSENSSPEKKKKRSPRMSCSARSPRVTTLSDALQTIEDLKTLMSENEQKHLTEVKKLETELAAERSQSLTASNRHGPILLDAGDSSSSQSQSGPESPDAATLAVAAAVSEPTSEVAVKTLMDEGAQEELGRKLSDLGEAKYDDIVMPLVTPVVEITPDSPKKTKDGKRKVHIKRKAAAPLVFTPTKDDSVSIQDLALHRTSQDVKSVSKQKRTHAAVASCAKPETTKRTERSGRTKSPSSSTRRRSTSSSHRKIVWKDEAVDADSDFESDDKGDEDFVPEEEDENESVTNNRRRKRRATASTKQRKTKKHQGKKRPSSGHSPISCKKVAVAIDG